MHYVRKNTICNYRFICLTGPFFQGENDKEKNKMQQLPKNIGMTLLILP